MQSLLWQKDRLMKEKDLFNRKRQAEEQAAQQEEDQKNKQLKQIEILEDVKRDIQKNLKKKETELFKQKDDIKELQKTKQVLTHRTMEMKASLEPKEQQIESLKE